MYLLKFCSENLKGSDHFGDVDVGSRRVLKLLSKK
jgi:hypothetical protein